MLSIVATLTRVVLPLQLRQAGFPPQWPYAIHLLAHLHNYSLCALWHSAAVEVELQHKRWQLRCNKATSVLPCCT